MSKRNKKNWKSTKSYEEYIKLFKEACENLGRTIYKTELEKHIFDLPTEHYLIKNCPDKNVKDYNNFLVWLGYEPNYKPTNKHKKYNFEIAYKEFAKQDLILLPQKYTSCSVKMKFICPKHPDEIQERSLNTLIFRHHGCRYCYLDNNYGENTSVWKGGLSPLNIYLRELIIEWKKDSMANCDYKCILTSDKFDDIHHLYSFNKIIRETMEECQLSIYQKINEYSEQELELIKNTFLNIHNKYPLGVCLRKDIHDLYHHIYGDDNTPEQFEEFKQRYNNGEFIVEIKQKRKSYLKNKRPFNVYRKDDNSFVMTSDNPRDCVIKLGLKNVDGMNKCLNKRRTYHSGYLFYYIDEDPFLNK